MSVAQNTSLKKLVSLLLDWFSANSRDLPWRRTNDPYAIWISEIIISLTNTQYGILQYGSRLQGKSLAFAAYHGSRVATIAAILSLCSKVHKTVIRTPCGQVGNPNAGASL